MYRVLAFVFFCGLAGGSTIAEAQWGGYGYGYGFLNGGAWWNGSVYSGVIEDQRPPYFALHPPVYYSYPVPRTYGYSPFAYPGCTPTPDLHLEVVEPQMVPNPFVPGEAAPKQGEDAEPATSAEATGNRTAAAPRRIRNPFVDATIARTAPVDKPMIRDAQGRVLAARADADSSR
jgi:hypothetical protein